MEQKPVNTEEKSSVNNTDPEFKGIPIPKEYLPSLTGDQRVLDIGSGPKNSKLLTELLGNATSLPQVIKVDYFKENLDQTGGHRVQTDAIRLPIQDRTVDVVVTSELTPDNPYFKSSNWDGRSDNKQRLLAEIQRVVKPGGYWLAYNEDLDPILDGLPPGFVSTFQFINRIHIIPNRLAAHALSFGVFEKVAEEVPSALIDQNITWDGKIYQDDFTRTLTQAYPPSRILGKDVIALINSSSSEPQIIKQLKNIFPYITDEDARVFIRAAATGDWTADVIAVNTPDISQYLDDLASPIGGWYARSGKYDHRYKNIHSDSAHSVRIREALRSNNYHVSVFDGHIRIIPTQRFFDRFLFLSTTEIVDIDSNKARVRKHYST